LKIRNKQKLQIATYIANVALIINRIIIHFLLGFSIDKHITINKPNTIIDIWCNIQFIIIHKISMVGCILLATIHLKLQRLKSNIISFGGINIIFVGDCLQFPPINDMPLH
jgi:hypothetical protein